MASTRFKINPGWFEEALKGSIAEGACRAKAEQTLASAQGGAPVETGAYRASIHMIDETHPTRRAFHIVAGVEYAMIVESKTGNLARSL